MSSMTMLKRLAGITVATTCLALATTGSAQALTLKFDDISTNYFTPMPNAYGGLDWSNFFVENGTNANASNTGYANGIVSQNNAAYNGAGLPAEISSNVAFTFNSAYLTGAWSNGLNILIEGYANGILSNSQTVTVDTTSPTLFSLNWSNINRLKFSASGGTDIFSSTLKRTHFAMDNFTFNEPVTPVPTPALLPGLVGLGFGVLRKRRGCSDG
jgi:hypothetical protein